MNTSDIINEIFETLLKIVRSNRKMENLLNDNYRRAIIDFLNIMPEDDKEDFAKYYGILKTILACIDFNKLIGFANRSNIPSIEVKSKNIACEFLLSKFEDDKKNKKFVEKLLQHLNNVFEVVDYVLKNPKEIAANANVFTNINDDIF